jgi:hypothetical protein
VPVDDRWAVRLERPRSAARYVDDRIAEALAWWQPAGSPRLRSEQAGLPRKRLHDLRHGCATIMIAAGASPRAVVEQLGHSQISLTMDTYSDVLPDVLRREAENVAALLEAPKSAMPDPVVVTGVVNRPAAAKREALDAQRANKKRRETRRFSSGPPRDRTEDPLIIETC